MSQVRRKARIARVEALSPAVRGLSLEVEDGPLSFAAGQWVNLYVQTPAGTTKRAYSIASAPGAQQLELAVTLVPEGEVSPALHRLQSGQVLELDGPHGFFTREQDLREQSALFVATGTGLCPFRSMLLAGGLGAKVTLLFGCRTEADRLWHEELSALAAQGAFELVTTLSRGSEAWPGRRGHVQGHVVEFARALGEPHVFVCGLSRMVSEVRAICKTQLGYDRTRIHTERYD